MVFRADWADTYTLHPPHTIKKLSLLTAEAGLFLCLSSVHILLSIAVLPIRTTSTVVATFPNPNSYCSLLFLVDGQALHRYHYHCGKTIK